MKKSLICLFYPAMTLCALPQIFGQDPLDRTFENIEEIEMSISSGDVTFERTSGTDIRIQMRHTYEFDYQPILEQRGDRLTIKEDRRTMPRSYSGSAEWTLTLPDGLEVSFNTGSGDVEVTKLNIECEMNSGSGDFDLREISGEFEINTGSGDITILESDGEFGLNTGSGDINFRDVTADVMANTGSGEIECEGLTLSGNSSFNSGSGNVFVEITTELDFDLSINSGSGDAVLDFNANSIEGLITMEANKRNGRISAPFEFDSSEEIDNGSNTIIRKTKKLGSKDLRISVTSGSGTAEVIR